MADHADIPEQPLPSGEEIAWGRREIEAAIAGLDQATRRFTRHVNALQDPRPTPSPPAADPPRRSTVLEPSAGADRDGAFEEQMQNAEREAREYLDRAKRRADSLVTTMIGAVEREAAEIRHDAEIGIRERWRAIEVEAGRYLDDARRVADGMVSERQQRISSLSDGIVERARSLTAGMDDAEQVRRQFDQFVRALSETAGRIAAQPQGRAETEISRLQGRQDEIRRDALAA